jgi:hypothetical protein
MRLYNVVVVAITLTSLAETEFDDSLFNGILRLSQHQIKNFFSVCPDKKKHIRPEINIALQVPARMSARIIRKYQIF